MAVPGDQPVAEPLVEAVIARQLAANADSHLRVPLGVGIPVDPVHQCRPDALALQGGIDGNSPNTEITGFAIEPQTPDTAPIEQSHGPA